MMILLEGGTNMIYITLSLESLEVRMTFLTWFRLIGLFIRISLTSGGDYLFRNNMEKICLKE